MLTAVVAVIAPTGGIGRLDGRLPWHPHRLLFDIFFLSLVTTNGYTVTNQRFTINDKPDGNAVVMGRRTFESLPPRMRPLPNRRNIILTRGSGIPGVETAGSLDDAVMMCRDYPVFVLGGKAVYEEAIGKGVPFLVTKITSFPNSVHADIALDLGGFDSCGFKCTDITADAFYELVRLKPELRDKGELVGGVVVEGDFRYAFYMYHL